MKRLLALSLTLLTTSLAAQSVLVVSPHPDDDVIGCGGAVIHHVEAGDAIMTVYLTSGEGGMPVPEDPAERGLIREAEGRAGSKVMGTQRTKFLRLPDGGVQVDRDTIWLLEQIIDEERPDVIYTSHEGDGHRDHEAAGLLVRIAVVRVNHRDATYKPLVRFFEVWAPFKRPTYFENITDVIDHKLTALSNHVSQLNVINYDEAIKGLNHYRACMQGRFAGIGSGYAEAYDEWQV